MTITADVYDFAIFLIGLGFFIFVIALVPALLQLKRQGVGLINIPQRGVNGFKGNV